MDYWQSIADALTALLLVALLLVAVLILVIASNSGWLEGLSSGGGNAQEQNEDGRNDASYRDDGGGSGDGENDEDDNARSSGGGGTTNYVDPDPGKGDAEQRSLAAVRVTVVDAETENTIEQAGISFQLNGDNGALSLASYYPERTEYSQFETTAQGLFFFPEKIATGHYRLVQVIAPEGYDLADDVEFDIDASYGWSAPLEIVVSLHPCKNVVRVQQQDAISQDGVSGGVWDVVAMQDIATIDGTVRCKKDEVAGSIVVGDDGYGESEELYLGEYRLQQANYPQGYAAYQDDEDKSLIIQVEKKLEGDEVAPLHSFDMNMTRYVIRLIDEETQQPLQGAGFRLSSSDSSIASKSMATDADGVVSFDALDKGKNYAIAQESSLNGYQLASNIEFAVSDQGLIDESPCVDVFVSNYIIRAAISTKGLILRKPIAGEDMSLFAADGSLVGEWESGNSAKTFEGLEPGRYVISGPYGEKDISIQDKSGTQKYGYFFVTAYDFFALMAAVIVAIVAMGAAIAAGKRQARGKDGEKWKK